MKKSDCARASITVAAIDAIDDLIEALKEPVEDGHDRHVLQLTSCHPCESGSISCNDVEIDTVTAIKILPRVKTMLIEEMQAIGVEL